MAQHGSAVAGFEDTVPDKVDEHLTDVVRIFAQQVEVKKTHHVVLKEDAAGCGEGFLDIFADRPGIQRGMAGIAGLNDRAEISVPRQPVDGGEQLADVQVVCGAVGQRL